MSHPVTKRPQALKDLVEQAEFIARDSLDAAERFLDAAEATFDSLAQGPLLGELCHFQNPKTARLRMWQIRGFENHIVFYRPTASSVDIVRVIHAARDYQSLFENE